MKQFLISFDVHAMDHIRASIQQPSRPRPGGLGAVVEEPHRQARLAGQAGPQTSDAQFAHIPIPAQDGRTARQDLVFVDLLAQDCRGLQSGSRQAWHLILPTRIRQAYWVRIVRPAQLFCARSLDTLGHPKADSDLKGTMRREPRERADRGHLLAPAVSSPVRVSVGSFRAGPLEILSLAGWRI